MDRPTHTAFLLLWVSGIIALELLVLAPEPHTQDIPYSQFKHVLGENSITDVTVGQTTIPGTFVPTVSTPDVGPPAPPLPVQRFITPRIEDPDLVKELEAHDMRPLAKVVGKGMGVGHRLIADDVRTTQGSIAGGV